jgi:hypothetical protein
VAYGQFRTSNLPDAGDAETSDHAVSQDQNDIAAFWVPTGHYPVFLSNWTFIETHAMPLSKLANCIGNGLEHAVKPLSIGGVRLRNHR